MARHPECRCKTAFSYNKKHLRSGHSHCRNRCCITLPAKNNKKQHHAYQRYISSAGFCSHCITPAFPYYKFLTNSLNLLPRTSQSRNISQLAHAGERSTASPLSAFSAQTLTASSRLSVMMMLSNPHLHCCFLHFFLFNNTEQYQIFYFAVKRLDPFRVIGAFVISASDQQSRA